MRPSHCIELLAKALPAKRSVFLWGPPGIGKSQVVRQAALRIYGEQARLVDLRAATLDPVDFRGVPTVTKAGLTKWAPPSFLPSEGKGILFLDELAQADTMVQSACLELVLDRRCGDYQLPDDWLCVAASNRQSDRAGANRLGTALLNRFMHIEMELSMDDWHLWAANADVHPLVRGFIAFRPELLHVFDPKADVLAFPTPRAWEMVSDIYKQGIPDYLLYEAVKGIVGKEAATEFGAFLQCYCKIPPKDSVLKSPDTCRVPEEASVMWALAVAMVEWMRAGDLDTVRACVTYGCRMRRDLMTWLMVGAYAAHKAKLFAIPEAKKWVIANAALLGAA